MTESAKLESVLEMALSVRPHELGCDDCYEYFAAYADHLSEGKSMPEPLILIGEHLERCGSCMEELQYLLDAMKNSR